MKRLCLAFTLCCISTAPAFADVRDAVLAIEGSTALSLVSFDTQPRKASVRSVPDGIEVLVQGVHAAQARITPPDTHLLSAIDISPVQGGVRLLYHFNEGPKTGSIEVYKNAILVRANFAHTLKAQKASLTFRPSVKTKIAASTPPQPSPAVHASVAPEHETSEATSKAAEHKGQSPGSANDHTPAPEETKPPTHDGDAPKPEHNEVQGTGMIRDASATQTSKSLDKKTCDAAQKAIEDDPWALDKLSLYGACIAKEGRKDEAKEVFERLLTFDPDMISAYMGLGSIAQESGDTTAARRHFQQALGLGGSDAQAAQIRAMLGTLGDAH